MRTTLFLQRLLAFVVIFVLASCGGGGGGGGGGSSSSGGGGSTFSVSLDHTSINITLTEGQSTSPILVIATANGTLPGVVYVGAEVEGSGVAPDVPFSIVGTTVQFSVYAATGLSPGTYTGRVLFYACSDPYCATPIGGTPIAIPYKVVVQPKFTVTPNPVTLTAVSGNGTTGSFTVTIPAGASSFTSSVTSGSSWLQLGSVSGTTQSLVAKSVRTGTYTGSVQVTLNNGQTSAVTVLYTVSSPVGGEHDLTATPGSLSFAATEGFAAPAQTLSLSLPTWAPAATLSYAVTYGSGATGWLSYSAGTGSVDVTASAAALSKGTYSATLTITPSVGTAVSVPVNMTVGAGLVVPANRTILVNTETTTTSLSGSATIVGAGSASSVSWSAVSDKSWLQLTRSAGIAGTNVTYDISAADVAAMANSTDNVATVTVSSSTPSVTSVQFTVTLQKRLPEVLNVGPYLLINGSTTRIHIRGKGFDSVGNLATRLQTSGLPVSGLAKINDTELSLDAAPASVANYAISIGNALGISSPSASATVIAPQDYAYAAIPSSGKKRTLLFDEQRQSAYVVNVDNETLTRFRHGGGSWSVDHVPMAAILDAGMAPDGKNVMVTSSVGALKLLDPSTLSTDFSTSYAPGFYRGLSYVSQGIPTSNDGRAWLPAGSGWNEWLYFDYRTRTFNARPSQPLLSTSFYGGPWGAMARDGERLLLTQSAGISPAPPMLYSDAYDSLLKVNGAGLTFSYDSQMSDSGGRVLFDYYEVRDSEFNLVGRTVIPAADSNYFGVAGAMSPDGKRAYVLAYNSNAINNSASTSFVPRVYVFDTTSGPGNLALVTFFDISHYPTCRSPDYGCGLRPRATISPDGKTLFFVGDANFIVAPIPTSALPASLSVSITGKVFSPRKGLPKLPWSPAP